MAQQKGTIKFFNTTKGYGFITPEGGSKDIFVHITALERSGIREVREGTTVFFDVEDDRRGRGQQATNIKLA
jgi:CspA family cold shock protein